MVRDLDVIAIGNAIVDMIASSDDAFLKHVNIQKGAMELIDSERARFLEAVSYTHLTLPTNDQV